MELNSLKRTGQLLTLCKSPDEWSHTQSCKDANFVQHFRQASISSTQQVQAHVNPVQIHYNVASGFLF
jgi:hypothetical protein